MPKFLRVLQNKGRKINFTFKWYQHKTTKSRWVAIVESEPLTLDFINRMITAMRPGNKIANDAWFTNAKIEDEQKIDLTNEMKHSILMGLPNVPPKGKKILTKEIKEMKIKRTEKGFIFIYELESIMEL